MICYMFSCPNRITTISALLLALTFGFSQTAFAGDECCWIDTKTGKQVNTIPGGCLYEDEGKLCSGYATGGDRDRAFNPKTGQNFARQPGGCWIDTKTGKQVNTIPGGCLYEDEGKLCSGYATGGDKDRAFNPKTGQNFARVPCPPPATGNPPPESPKVSLITPGWSGFYFGLNAVKNWSHVQSIENLLVFDEQEQRLHESTINQFTDSGDTLGGGIVAGYNFAPWDRIRLGLFAEFDYLNQTINHTFADGTLLGTTTHWTGTVGAKAGVVIMPSLLIYGITGVSLLKEDLNINFGGPATSQNKTVAGSTLGAGVEYQPSVLQRFGVPISVFAQYQHTWWDHVIHYTPTPLPEFMFDFRRGDDTIKFGVNVYFH